MHDKTATFFDFINLNVTGVYIKYRIFVVGQDCGKLAPPEHGWIFGSKTTHPNSVFFNCGASYTLVGSSKRTCLINGSWSGQQPRCLGNKKKCCCFSFWSTIHLILQSLLIIKPILNNSLFLFCFLVCFDK